MDVLNKINEMIKDGYSVGFKGSEMGDQYIRLVVKKRDKAELYDMTQMALTTDAVLASVLNDAAASLKKK